LRPGRGSRSVRERVNGLTGPLEKLARNSLKFKVFVFSFFQKQILMNNLINFDLILMSFSVQILSNDIICSDNSKVIKVLLENIMRMLKVFPLRT
jgi:hypothetical protein